MSWWGALEIKLPFWVIPSWGKRARQASCWAAIGCRLPWVKLHSSTEAILGRIDSWGCQWDSSQPLGKWVLQSWRKNLGSTSQPHHEVIYPRSHVTCQNKWDLDSASRWLVLHSFHSHFASLSTAPHAFHPTFKTPKPSTILLWNNSTPAYKEGTFPWILSKPLCGDC